LKVLEFDFDKWATLYIANSLHQRSQNMQPGQILRYKLNKKTYHTVISSEK